MSEPNVYYIYNEYVLGDVDYYEDIYEEIVEYDDSNEWYNIDESEADV